MADFGSVSVPDHFPDQGIDVDALMPNVPRRAWHSERNFPERFPDDTAGIVVDLIRFPAELMDRIPGLKLLSFAGTGVSDWVDVPYATQRGITVCNVPDWGNDSIAEFTFALLLAVAKKLFPSHAMAMTEDWREEEVTSLEIRGMTMGLVGLGNIGQRVAELAHGFGLRVLCYTANPNRPRTLSTPVEFVGLDDLLRQSNILSLHTKLTPETQHLIGKREIGLLPDGAIVVNTARGKVIDTDALVEALRSGKLFGAGLDVFEEEPLPNDHPLKKLDNVVLAPHVAGQTDTARKKRQGTSASNVDAFITGNPRNVVNPEVLR
jgi:phosphoglycerate dehydrogenase-like enzyme